VYGPLTWQRNSVSVAFEDLKKAGWSDWDYNDFIVHITIEQGLTPAGELAALKLTYTSRARRRLRSPLPACLPSAGWRARESGGARQRRPTDRPAA
jgi:hypothetical protein